MVYALYGNWKQNKITEFRRKIMIRLKTFFENGRYPDNNEFKTHEV